MITENVKNTDNNFLEIQVLPHREYNVPFVVFDRIVSETFATFGSDGKPKFFTVDAFESYYNQMLEKSIKLEENEDNKNELSENFNKLCIDWLSHIKVKYKTEHKKEPNFIQPFLDYCKAKESQKQPKSETIENENKQKFIAKEYALTYIFDLYANGKILPINRIDGGYNQKEIEDVGIAKGLKGNTFMKAVREVKKFDIHKETDLQKISKDWINAVRILSENWETTQTYLISKKLVKE